MPRTDAPEALTPKQENAIYFPVCEERSVFNAEIRVPPRPESRLKLPGVRRADSAKVRRRQPYHYTRTRPQHVLTLLSKVNNDDKHRTVHPILAAPTRVKMEVTNVRDCLPPKIPKRGFPRRAAVLEPGAELAFIRCRRTGPNPDVDVKLEIAAEPALHKLIGVGEWVGRCGTFLAGLLGEFSDPPKGIAEVEPEARVWTQPHD